MDKAVREMYENFKSLYPNLSKSAVGYRPYGYFTIMIWFDDGSKMVYDDFKKQGHWVKS